MSDDEIQDRDPDAVLHVQGAMMAIIEDDGGKKVSAIVRLSVAPQASAGSPHSAQKISLALSEEQLRTLATAFTEAADMIAHPLVGHA